MSKRKLSDNNDGGEHESLFAEIDQFNITNNFLMKNSDI